MIAMMRSNDAYRGFTHDVFCFTMIQELIARSLGVQVGEYHHFATSLHLYAQDVNKVSDYLNEGFQNPTFAMPKMPSGCQRRNLCSFLETERLIRIGDITKAAQIKLPVYWHDLSLVLLRHADRKFRRGTKLLDENFSQISDKFYKNFFIKGPKMLSERPEKTAIQEKFNFGDKDEG
jgi:thymidylate synthase